MPKPVILRRPLPSMYRVGAKFTADVPDGMMFEAEAGKETLACANATVIKTGQSADNRRYVWLWVELPGVTCRVLYDGLGKLFVREGERLKVDKRIGLTSVAKGEKLARFYFEVRAYPGNVAVEPDFYDGYTDVRVSRALPQKQ